LLADADFARGVAEAQTGNPAGFNLIQRARQLAPHEGHYAEVMGDGQLLEAESGRFPVAAALANAIASYDAAIADAPLESILYLKRGSAAAYGVSTGQPHLAGPAEADMAHALQLAPFRSAYYQQWGQDRLAMGRPADAIPLFEKAIQLGPSDASLFASYSQALRAVGRMQEADAAYATFVRQSAAPAFSSLSS